MIVFTMICLLLMENATDALNVTQHKTIGAPYLHAFGSRLVVFFAFGGNYTFSQFTSNLRTFANALNCANRQQLITFYFGDLSTKIDCNYRTNLVDCVNGILDNPMNATNAFEVRSYASKM